MKKRVAIIGAGPVGLAAAAHAISRELEPIVFEQGPEPAHAVRQWSHVRMFSPWRFNVDDTARALLNAAGHAVSDSDEDFPTGQELIDNYLTPLATRTALASAIKTNTRVTCITRKGIDKVKTAGRNAAPFVLHVQSECCAQRFEADAVIDASGTWFTPNPAGADGTHADGEIENRDRIAYTMPDILGRERAFYEGLTVAVLGSGHSALGNVVALSQLAAADPATKIIWLTRKTDLEKAFGSGDRDQLRERGALGQAFKMLVTSGTVTVERGFFLKTFEREGDRLLITGETRCGKRSVIADRLVAATGFRPDLRILRELRVELDPAIESPTALAPLIDPNVHSCGSVKAHGAKELSHPEEGLYIAGMKSYGRAPTFLMKTGYEQVRSIVAQIAGDLEAAARVELTLPETGVCSARIDDAKPVSEKSGGSKPEIAEVI